MDGMMEGWRRGQREKQRQRKTERRETDKREWREKKREMRYTDRRRGEGESVNLCAGQRNSQINEFKTNVPNESIAHGNPIPSSHAPEGLLTETHTRTHTHTHRNAQACSMQTAKRIKYSLRTL